MPHALDFARSSAPWTARYSEGCVILYLYPASWFKRGEARVCSLVPTTIYEGSHGSWILMFCVPHGLHPCPSIPKLKCPQWDALMGSSPVRPSANRRQHPQTGIPGTAGEQKGEKQKRVTD